MKHLIALSFSLFALVTGSSLRIAAVSKPGAFLQVTDEVCDCAFHGLCSLHGALDFMRCIRDGCGSGNCQCITKDGDNHFWGACQQMADGCPGLGMECDAEQARLGGDLVTLYGMENRLSETEKEEENDEGAAKTETEKEEEENDEGAAKTETEKEEEEEENDGAEQANLDNEDLPPGWEAHWSSDYDRVYYGNDETGEVTWTKPKGSAKAAVKKAANKVAKKPENTVPKRHYKSKVKSLQSHEHHMFAKGTITGVLVLCLTVCLVRNSDSMIRKHSWSTVDAVVTTFLAVSWYHVIIHYLDFAGYKGLEKLAVHLLIATALLLVSSLVSWIMQRQASKDNNADMAESVNTFNGIFDPIVMWTFAGSVSTAQQLAKPSEFYVLVTTVAMVGFYALLAAFWYPVVGSVTRMGWSEGTITTLMGAALAAGTVLWVHMILIGSYQTVEDPHPNAPGLSKTLFLNAFGLLYIVIACVVAKPLHRAIKNTNKTQNYLNWRTLSVLAVFTSHLPKFSCVCSLGHLIIDNFGYQEGEIEARLLLTLLNTFIGMGIVIICAKSKALNADPDQTLTAILVGLGGFMVGAAWAGLLDNSINQMVKGYRHPFVSKIEITAFLTACIFPTYFYYLKPLIDSEGK